MEYFLKASAITALFYICYTCLLQRETFFESNRWFLITGILATVVAPLLIIPIYIENPNTALDLSAYSTNASTANTTNTDYNFIIISSIYLIGVSFFLIKLVIELASLVQLLCKNKSYKKNGFNIIETEDTISPFSFFKYIVYNPKQFNQEELKHIINHEKVHVNQWHSIDTLLMQLASIVFWFNPFIWLYKKEALQNLEFIADKNAQSISSCKKSYEYVLLKTTVSNPQLILTNNFYTSLIKKRIVMLHKSKSNKLNLLKYTLILPVLALFLMSFNTKEVYLNQSTVNNNQTTIGSIEIAIIDKNYTDAALEEVKATFKKNNVDLSFKAIKRNDLNEIIALKIKGVSQNTKTNYSSDSKDAIKPIKITYNSKNESLIIGTIEEDRTQITEDITTKIVKSGSGSNLIITEEDATESNHDIEVIVEDENKNSEEDKVVIIRKTKDLDSDASEKEEKTIFITKKEFQNKQTSVEDEDDIDIIETITDDDSSMIATDIENSVLIFIDEKESTRKAMEELDPNHISSMQVFKGDKMTKKYGPKAKDGVIFITTK